MSRAEKVDLNHFSEAVEEVLSDYEGNCNEAVQEAVQDISKEALAMLKKVSPVAKSGPTKGKYKKGWSRVVSNDKFVHNATLYGKTPATYAVAHLLEFGHAKRNGGRVNAIPHIVKVEEWVGKNFVLQVRKEIEQ